MKNIKLTIEYEGTNYHGWQEQNNLITVEGTLRKALETMTKEEIKLFGSGRTDGKVHALGQVANFFTNSTIPGERYKYALKFLLPDDISIVDSEEVDLNFHSRFSATKKRYKYIVYNGKLPKAIYRNFSYHVSHNIDMEKMILASRYLVGTHDFRSFMASHANAYSTVRTIHEIKIEKNKDLIEFIIVGNSFLHNMVRIIVGTLLFVGVGRLNVEDITRIISQKDRKCSGPTVQPQGLFLEKVYYS